MESLDIRITTKTSETVKDYHKAIYWDNRIIFLKKLLHTFYYWVEGFYLPQSYLSLKETIQILRETNL